MREQDQWDRPAGRRLFGGRVARWAAAVVAAVLLALALAVAIFPWGLMASHAAAPLAAALGRPVTVARGHRIGWFSFVPTVELENVAIAQPDWAGPGTFARIDHARIRFAALPLLLGHFRPQAIDLAGVALDLRRDATGRANWQKPRGGSEGGGSPLAIRRLTISDGRFTLTDAKRHVTLRGSLASDPKRGLAIEGTGTQRGLPLRLVARGSALGSVDPGRPYPLRLSVRSPLVAMEARALLDHPLDLAHFTARMAARGRDIRYLDDIIQAGLFPSQDFRLTGMIRHDGPAWRIDRVAGSVGRSVLSAHAQVRRHDGRARLEGDIDADSFDFADFASDSQQARGRAERAAIGKRLIPNTRIRLDTLARLDGRLHLRAARLLGAAPLTSLDTVVTLDHSRLVLAPLSVGLTAGRASGRVTVDSRGATPDLTVDARVEGSRIEALFLSDRSVTGPLRARIRLEGRGDRVRQAIGRASGRVGLAVPSGSARRDYATFAGGDVLKSAGAAIAGGNGRVPLRCVVAAFEARGGVLSPAPLVMDTAVARSDGQGRITLADERIDLRLVGSPKHPGLLLSKAPIRVFGTLADPKLDIRPPQAERRDKVGVLDRVGFFLKKLHVRGKDTPPAPDADCAGLAARALR